MSQLTIPHALDLALQHHRAGRLAEAERIYRQILARQPEHTEAMHYLGVIAHQAGRNDIAVDLIRRAIAIKPSYAEAHSNLGNVLQDKGQLDEAIASYRQVIALRPNLPETHYNLGVALARNSQLDGAIAACRQALALSPNYAEAHNALGIALKDKGQIDEAIASYRQAIALKPNLPEAHYCLALALLLQKDFQSGWQEYEWRLKCKDFPSLGRNLTQPKWDGRALEARTILLYTDEGFGDAVQFIRYLPLLAQRCGKIIIACRPELPRLLRIMADGCQIVALGQPLPAFDFHCSLLSLPHVFGTTLANIPGTVPYLQADAEDAGRWRHRLADHSPIVNVGLAWAGSSTNKNDRNRSMKLARLAPLGQLPGVRFISLQKGEAAAEGKTPPAGMELVDWTAELKDFADTAALVANLDLIIAVDTAVVHLAGAMGKPVWTLLPIVPDWRWLLEREDSPWYPSMRLFRQPSWGDWDSVITRVVDSFSLWIKNRV